jgi:hypothetical protein
MHPFGSYSSPDSPDVILNDLLRECADALDALLVPFRATRKRGHEDVLTLLADPETSPEVSGRIAGLSRFLTLLRPLYLDCYITAELWRQQYEQASPTEQPALLAIHNPRTAARLLDALQLLNNEVITDFILFELWIPEAFAEDPDHARL